MYAFRSPIAPIELRASIAFCTSSGGVIALMKKSTSSRPYLRELLAIFGASRRRSRRTSPADRAGSICDVASKSVSRETIRSLRNDVISSVVYLPCVPTRVIEQLGRVDHSERELADAPQPHHAEILVADGDRLPRAPFLIEERLLADEVDLGLKRRLLPRDRQQPSDDRHVHRVQRVPARAEFVEGLAVAKEDRLLVLLHDQLGPELDVGRAFRRHAMHERAVRLVEKLNDFQFAGPLQAPCAR